MRLRATYRLQLGPGLGFREARELVPYLRELGISHLYLSPVLQARSGSTHGYDVVDPTRISSELGGEEGFRELAGAGLGIVLDVVPNHMAASEENRHWSEPELRAKFFDVDTRTGFYRRFFDIGHLAGVRMEDPAVFETTHALVLALVHEGLVDGLRIDHPDGLSDPAGYLERLRRGGVEHVWVEKILEPGEELREWPVEGTVGYEFLNDAAALFVHPGAEGPLTALYEELTGERRPFAELALEAKLQVATEIFEPELRELHQELDVPNLPVALASFHVYRTYVEPWNDVVHPADREAIAAAALSDRLERILLLEERGHDAFVTRFQQSTGPVMAKGVEDTAFYRFNRLVALNEVGGDPARMGMSVEEFHAANIKRALRFPRHLLTSQTHDTKRSADVRARIGALSWIPGEWRERVLRWRELTAGLKRGDAPDANEEYLIYQTLVGAWPIDAGRLEAYLEKAMREAKVHTTWVEPNEEWEAAVKSFARGLLAHRPFLDDFEPFAAEVARRGEHAALGQVLLKLASPGVPDIYNGDELPFLALVDPDNRRAVDWARRRELLAEVRSGARVRAETRKLALIARGLDLRRRRPEAFEGAYMPLDAGARVCAFLREREVLVVVPLVEGGDGADIEIPAAAEGRWRDAVTGAEHVLAGVVPVSALVREFPVALLERVSADAGGHTSGVSESGWTPEGWEDRGPSVPDRLPRVEDLPVADQGYDRDAVQYAFEAFYRHAAQLDATLRVLESMETFARQAGELRADIRSLRAASWGPLPATRPAWRPQVEQRALVRGGGAVGPALPRLALEAAFIVLVAVGAAVADLSTPLIVGLVLASWVLVGVSEFVASTRRAPLRPALLAPPPARSAPAPAEPAPQAEAAVSEATMIEAPPPLDEVEAAEAAPQPEAASEPEPEPAFEAVAEVEEVEPEPAAEPEPGRDFVAQSHEVSWGDTSSPAAEPEAVSEPEPEPEPAPVAPDEKPRRRWFRRRPAEVVAEAPAVLPSGHVRVVPPPAEPDSEAGAGVAEEQPEAVVALPGVPALQPEGAGPEAAPEAEPEPQPSQPDEPAPAIPEPAFSELEEVVEPGAARPDVVPEPEPVAEAAVEPEPDREFVAQSHEVVWEEPAEAPAGDEPLPEAFAEAQPAVEPDQDEEFVAQSHEVVWEEPAEALVEDEPSPEVGAVPEPAPPHEPGADAEREPAGEPYFVAQSHEVSWDETTSPEPDGLVEPDELEPPAEPEAAESEPAAEPVEAEIWPGSAPGERSAAEDEPAEDAPRRRSWFRRRQADVATTAAEPVSHVERIEVEHAVLPEQVDVPWDAGADAAAEEEPLAADPWEQGPESFGIELEPATADEHEPQPTERRPHAEPSDRDPPPESVTGLEGRPQPVRLRRGRR